MTTLPYTLHSSKADAIANAQSLSDDNGAPVGIWRSTRTGWFLVSEDSEFDETGFVMWAVVDPQTESEAV